MSVTTLHLMNQRRVAALLGISRATAARWARAGILRLVALPGRRWRMAECDVVNFARRTKDAK